VSVTAEGKQVKLPVKSQTSKPQIRTGRIEARAPTRIDLAGGTLDIWPLYLFHSGALTVNCAITRHASCTIDPGPRDSRRITLVSLDTHRRESFVSFGALARAPRYRLPLLAHLARFFLERSGKRAGFTLTTDSEAPAGAGIGGSSAMAVAICAALERFSGDAEGTGADTPRRQDWIHVSRDIEAIVIRVPTGTQDHYPPAFGGLSAIHLEPGGERREPLPADLDELERRLVLCYTGKPRQSAINNWEVFVRHINGDRRVARNLDQIADVARQVRAALLRNDWNKVGRLVRAEWEFRRRNLPTISTPTIDRIIAQARKKGAIGGKVCGAGGGGCVALVIEPGSRAGVEAAVAAAGGTILPHRIDRAGVRVRVSRPDRA
jgi:D-glycero-alpha-D-manno-heptose-7-phosphate kinase